MKITVNPETKAGGFGYVDEGEYTLRVKAVELKQKEHPYLSWQFEFADPNVKAVEADMSVGTIFENTTLKEDAQFKLREVCDALGLEWGDFDTEEVKGMELQAKVSIGEYQGKKRNEVSRYLPKK